MQLPDPCPLLPSLHIRWTAAVPGGGVGQRSPTFQVKVTAAAVGCSDTAGTPFAGPALLHAPSLPHGAFHEACPPGSLLGEEEGELRGGVAECGGTGGGAARSPELLGGACARLTPAEPPPVERGVTTIRTRRTPGTSSSALMVEMISTIQMLSCCSLALSALMLHVNLCCLLVGLERRARLVLMSRWVGQICNAASHCLRGVCFQRVRQFNEADEDLTGSLPFIYKL